MSAIVQHIEQKYKFKSSFVIALNYFLCIIIIKDVQMSEQYYC